MLPDYATCAVRKFESLNISQYKYLSRCPRFHRWLRTGSQAFVAVECEKDDHGSQDDIRQEWQHIFYVQRIFTKIP